MWGAIKHSVNNTMEIVFIYFSFKETGTPILALLKSPTSEEIIKRNIASNQASILPIKEIIITIIMPGSES